MQKKFVQLRLTDLAYTLSTQEKNPEYLYHYLLRSSEDEARPRLIAYRLPSSDSPSPSASGRPFTFAVLVWNWTKSKWLTGNVYEHIEEIRDDWRETSKTCGFEEIHGSDIIRTLTEVTHPYREPDPEYTSEYALNA